MTDDDTQGWGIVLPLAIASLIAACLFVEAHGDESFVLQSYLVGGAAIALVAFVARGRLHAMLTLARRRRGSTQSVRYWFSDDSWMDLAAVLAVVGVATVVDVSDPGRLRLGLGVVGVVSVAKVVQFAIKRLRRRRDPAGAPRPRK